MQAKSMPLYSIYFWFFAITIIIIFNNFLTACYTVNHWLGTIGTEVIFTLDCPDSLPAKSVAVAHALIVLACV